MKRKKTIAILDFEESAIKTITENINAEIHNVHVVSDDTYYGFVKKYLNPKNKPGRVIHALREDFYSDVVSFVIAFDSLNIQMTLSPPSDEDRLLGHPAKELFKEGQTWMQLFADVDTKNILMECLNLVRSSKRMQKVLSLSHITTEVRTASVELALEEGSNNNHIRINLKPIEVRYTQRTPIEKIESLDVVIADQSLIGEDPNAFLHTLNQEVKNAGLITPPNGVQLIATTANLQKINLDKMAESQLNALLAKPIETRRMLTAVTAACRSPYSINKFENFKFKSENIPARLAQRSELVDMAEFGATFKTGAPIQPGTLLYLFKSIFANAPDQNLCVRVYHTEKDEKTGVFLNSAVYFGITDAFLKFTRTYIREAYAQKKSKGSN